MLSAPDARRDAHFNLDNDFSEFSRPEYYIRYIGKSPLWIPQAWEFEPSRYLEPLESELATQVEYDMDEQGA